MISRIFRKPTIDDLLEELKKTTFKEEKANHIIEYVNINHLNQNSQTFLHLMVFEKKIESIKWLLKKNIDFNEIDSKGETALMIACRNGFYSAVEELIKIKVDVNIESYQGSTAIELAVVNGHFNIYKRLKPIIQNINKKNKKGETLLHLAIKSESTDIINDIFYDKKFKLEKNVLFYKDSYKKEEILNLLLEKFDKYHLKDSLGRNLLFYVVENGVKSKQIYYYLLDKNLDVNCIDKEGNNILLHLIKLIVLKKDNLIAKTKEDKEHYKEEIENLIKLIPYIIDSNINTNICNEKNETILSLCANTKDVELINLLLDNGVDVNILDKTNNTALSLIVRKGHEYLDTIHLLLDYGASANIRDLSGQTVIEKVIEAALIVKDEKKVVSNARKDIDFKTDYLGILVSILLNTDVNLTQYNSKDEPYFFEAVRYNAIDILKLLLKHGADINEPDKNGNNIIYTCMNEKGALRKDSEQREYYNNLQQIITLGANVNAKDSFGGITLHKAILDNDQNLIKILLHSGADINAIDYRGRHILHNAVWKNNLKIFKLVYTYNKPLLNEPDKFGVLPINYAAFLGYTDLVLEFIELSAHVNNPYKKTKYILNFLKKFHKNLDTLINNAITKAKKEKLSILVRNMRKEFEVEN